MNYDILLCGSGGIIKQGKYASGLLIFYELYVLSNIGMVVSTCLAGALVGSLLSGWIADEVGRRKAFQLCALPMIIGAAVR